MKTADELREFAHDCIALFDSNGAAAVFDRIEADALDNDQKVAFWTLLPSNVRSAIKAEGKARKDAAETVPG